jgi:hypothetical protein
VVWYADLDREAAVINPDFRDTLRYHGRTEPATVLADLKELRQRSETARERRRLWIICLVVALVTDVIVCIALHATATTVAGVFAGVVAAIVFGVLISRAARMTLDDRRRKLAVAVVRALGCDLPPGASLEVSIDFNKYHQDRFRTGSGQAANYQVSSYRQPWLAVAARLADGSEVELATELVARRKERAKTKGRKKIKEELSEHVRLAIRVAALPAGAEQRWPERLRAAVLPEGAYLHRALVKKDRLALEMRTHCQVRVTNKGSVTAGADAESRLANRHTLLMPVLAAYHALAACRRRA